MAKRFTPRAIIGRQDLGESLGICIINAPATGHSEFGQRWQSHGRDTFLSVIR